MYKIDRAGARRCGEADGRQPQHGHRKGDDGGGVCCGPGAEQALKRVTRRALQSLLSARKARNSKIGLSQSELFYINHEHNHCQREVSNALTQPHVQRPTLRSIDLFLSGAAAPTHTICWGNQQQLGSHS